MDGAGREVELGLEPRSAGSQVPAPLKTPCSLGTREDYPGKGEQRSQPSPGGHPPGFRLNLDTRNLK